MQHRPTRRTTEESNVFQEIITHAWRRPLRHRLESRKFCGPYRWRPAKPGTGRGFYSSSESALVMDREGSPLGLRLKWANDHLSHSRLSAVRGYCCDLDGAGDTLKPIVARLPRGRGFLAGWTMGKGMCGALDAYVWPDATEAARAAHGMAESDAEESAEHQEREREAEEDSE